MKILVVGATGATGRLLVSELLSRACEVRAIVRSPDKIPVEIRNDERLELIKASLLKLSREDLVNYVAGCNTIASCLGHNLSFKGIYGQPRKLVTDAAKRLCQAILTNNPEGSVKYVLMNTAGNRNRDLNEKLSGTHKFFIALIRLLLPPHVDNEQAADFLRTGIGQEHPSIQWSVVRPDTLINENEVGEYETFESPIRDPLFRPGKTSRINVAHFMAELITGDAKWQHWGGRMPVIYNSSSIK